jgi:hypothetical protein
MYIHIPASKKPIIGGRYNAVARTDPSLPTISTSAIESSKLSVTGSSNTGVSISIALEKHELHSESISSMCLRIVLV